MTNKCKTFLQSCPDAPVPHVENLSNCTDSDVPGAQNKIVGQRTEREMDEVVSKKEDEGSNTDLPEEKGLAFRDL